MTEDRIKFGRQRYFAGSLTIAMFCLLFSSMPHYSAAAVGGFCVVVMIISIGMLLYVAR